LRRGGNLRWWSRPLSIIAQAKIDEIKATGAEMVITAFSSVSALFFPMPEKEDPYYGDGYFRVCIKKYEWREFAER